MPDPKLEWTVNCRKSGEPVLPPQGAGKGDSFMCPACGSVAAFDDFTAIVNGPVTTAPKSKKTQGSHFVKRWRAHPCRAPRAKTWVVIALRDFHAKEALQVTLVLGLLSRVRLSGMTVSSNRGKMLVAGGHP